MAFSGSKVFSGTIWHKRFRPKVHSFQYPIFYLLLDLDDFSNDKRLPWCLSLDRFNIFSVYQTDYGHENTDNLKVSLKKRVQQSLKDLLPNLAVSKIMMLTMPKVFGYSFNPITVYYCYDISGAQVASLYEVHNTFGERHTYAFAFDNRCGEQVPSHHAKKHFHVSPFFKVEGEYTFKSTITPDNLSLTIDYDSDAQSRHFSAALNCKAHALRNRVLLGLLFKIPLVTFKAMAAIHFQALKLWIKGIKIYTKPEPPSEAYSFTNQQTKEKEINHG